MTAIGEHNLASVAERSFERHGDYPSLLFEGRWHTSAELFERSRRTAAGLAALGVGAGDRVVITMANCPEVGVLYNAVWRAGAVVTPATFLLAAPELRHVLADARARAVITTPEFLDKVREAADGLDTIRFIACLGDPPNGVVALASLEESPPAATVARGDDDLAALLYTGGTTGRAKGVMLSHANLSYTGRAAYDAAHVAGVVRALVTLPLSHAYGLLVTLAGMHADEPNVAVLLRWFDLQRFLAAIAEHQLQQSAVVPSMLQLLLSVPLEEHDLGSLRYLSCGSAPLAGEVEVEFRRRLPWVSIRQGYGLTESGALVSTNPVGRERAGSVGLPVPGCKVTILDDDGREVAAGEPGEICCRSPGVMAGYWESADATSAALRDGQLHTGDIGYLDGDGYLFVVDRKKDLIIRGGFNVYPRDVEDALLEHPAVVMAAVVGRPDSIHGEEVVAFVSLQPGAAHNGDELVGWARERIGGYKYPREVHVVDAVPLTAVGKVDRKALRARLAAALKPADSWRSAQASG